MPEQTDEFARFAAALAGQYELECEIGRGGMGVVYRARDLRLDRVVAIKTLPPHLAGDAVVRERFLREARTAGRLSHPNIVPIHRADEFDGHVFFVMGYVDGGSLAQHVRDRGILRRADCIRLLLDVTNALAYAHDHGVIHRDVKAENILIDRDAAHAFVTDFGIARLAEAAPLTATGQVLGSVYYLSPEQISGDAVDRRSDVYSLGVVAYLCLTGRFPFDAALASAVLIAHVTKAPPPVGAVAPTLPRALAEIVDRCLAKHPDDRFQSCGEVRAALAAISSTDVDPSAVDSTDVNLGDGDALSAEQPEVARNLISDTEAHAIIGRAADLQAATGIQPRLTPIAGARDAQRDALRTSGHDVRNVRDAAIEAGIASQYVEHALVERGLAPTLSRADASNAAPTAVPVVVEQHQPPNFFLGSPSRLQFEMVIDGEMPESDFDLIVDVIRQRLGEAGQLTVVGRSFAWHSEPRRGHVQVSILPRNHKTVIRVSDDVRAVAGGLFGPLMGGVSGVSIPIWTGAAVGMHNVPLAAVLWVGTSLSSYLCARGLFARASRKRKEALRALLDALAAQARESIDAARSAALASPYRTPRLR